MTNVRLEHTSDWPRSHAADLDASLEELASGPLGLNEYGALEDIRQQYPRPFRWELQPLLSFDSFQDLEQACVRALIAYSRAPTDAGARERYWQLNTLCEAVIQWPWKGQ